MLGEQAIVSNCLLESANRELFIGTFLYDNASWEARKTPMMSGLYDKFCSDFDKDMKVYFAALKKFILLKEKYQK